MVNIILQFQKNKKSDSVIAFNNKKVHFVVDDVKKKPKAGEYWECFLWVTKERYNLVRPFQKINKDEVEKAQERVNQFNKELKVLEKHLKDEDFASIVYDEHNKPYLLSQKPTRYLEKKYDSFIIKKQGGQTWLRPILNAEDRREFQKMLR